LKLFQKEKGHATVGLTLYSAGKSKLHMLIWPSEIEVHATRFAQSCPWTSPPYFFSFTFESKCSVRQYIQNVDSTRVIDSIHMNGSNSRAEDVTYSTNHIIRRWACAEFQDPLIGRRGPVASALHRIPDVSSSHLGPDIGDPTRYFIVFLSPSKTWQDNIHMGYDFAMCGRRVYQPFRGKYFLPLQWLLHDSINQKTSAVNTWNILPIYAEILLQIRPRPIPSFHNIFHFCSLIISTFYIAHFHTLYSSPLHMH
jgi:hypothetical protein